MSTLPLHPSPREEEEAEEEEEEEEERRLARALRGALDFAVSKLPQPPHQKQKQHTNFLTPQSPLPSSHQARSESEKRRVVGSVDVEGVAMAARLMQQEARRTGV